MLNYIDFDKLILDGVGEHYYGSIIKKALKGSSRIINIKGPARAGKTLTTVKCIKDLGLSNLKYFPVMNHMDEYDVLEELKSMVLEVLDYLVIDSSNFVVGINNILSDLLKLSNKLIVITQDIEVVGAETITIGEPLTFMKTFFGKENYNYINFNFYEENLLGENLISRLDTADYICDNMAGVRVNSKYLINFVKDRINNKCLRVIELKDENRKIVITSNVMQNTCINDDRLVPLMENITNLSNISVNDVTILIDVEKGCARSIIDTLDGQKEVVVDLRDTNEFIRRVKEWV